MDPLAESRLRLIENTDDVFDFKRWLGERRPVLAFDTETGGLEHWRCALRLVQFGDANTGWAIPWGDWAGLVKEVFATYDGELVAHNAAFDLHFLEPRGCKVRRELLHDTQVMAHTVDPTKRIGLKPLAERLIDKNAQAGQAELHTQMQRHKWGWDTVPLDLPIYWSYAALDTVLTARLFEVLAPQVRQSYSGVYDLEMAVLLVIADMERRGFRVDLDYTRSTSERLDRFTDEMRAYCRTMYDVSPTSPRQVTARLLADGVTLTKRTPNGKEWAFDKDVMEQLKDVHPLATDVYDIKRAGGFKTKYVDKILALADGDVIHASVNPLGAAEGSAGKGVRTARMSVSNPPLQQLPADSPLIRDCFIPRDGNKLLSVDFDQIEVRLLAHFAQEPRMIEAILGGLDWHTFSAGLMYGTDAPTKRQRQLSKSGTFGKLYGIGVKKFAIQQNVTEGEAATFLAMYDQTFPDIKRFIRDVENLARSREQTEGVAYVNTPVGRRNPLPTGERGYYKLVNYLIQGTAADVIKQKIVALDSAGLGPFMVLPVHDEVIFDVPEGQVAEVAAEAVRVMQDLDSFAVPLTAGAKISDRWGDAYREAA